MFSQACVILSTGGVWSGGGVVVTVGGGVSGRGSPNSEYIF